MTLKKMMVSLFFLLLMLFPIKSHAFRLLGPEAPKCSDAQVSEMVKGLIAEQVEIPEKK